MSAPPVPATVVRGVAWSLAGRVPAGLTVAAAVRALAGRERVTAWSGQWSAGAIVTCDPAPAPGPVEVVGTGGAEVGGGWFGYLGADGTRSFAWYPDLLRHDGTGWVYEALLGPDLHLDGARARCAGLVADLNRPVAPRPVLLEVRGLPDRTAHCVAVEECVRAIRRGEVYQANIAGRLDLRLHGTPHEAWARLVEEHDPARAGLVAEPALAAVSASPELFLHRRGRTVRTAPIKGTRPRTPGDLGERDRLAASAKDAAENVMIVDLMRNDLSRVCVPGTVRVPRLLAVEPHAGVWHLVSEVTGELVPGADDAALLEATFPPGSVTGAPKIRALELIAQLEATPRRLFTGALGYTSPLAGTELAVAIRTLEVEPGGATRLGVGGGVTVDSTPAEEWRECLTKAAPILRTLAPGWRGPPSPAETPAVLFETVLAIDGRPRWLADHVARIRRSWFALTGRPLGVDVGAAIEGAAARTRGGTRIRVDVSPGDGAGGRASVAVTVAPFTPVPLAEQHGLVLRVRPGAGGYRHKRADRTELDEAEAGVAPGETPLLVDPAGLVLESTRSSVFALAGGVPVTPPLDGRVLPGVARTAVLDHDRSARPALLHLAELAAGEGAFLTNALRGVQWVREVRDREGRTLATWPTPHPTIVRLAATLASDDR